MAASRSYFARPNYRFLTGDRDAPMTTDSVFELDESDLWNTASSALPTEWRKSVQSPRISRKSSSAKIHGGGAAIAVAAASVPVNVPDWSKILKSEYRENNRRTDSDLDDFEEEEEEVNGGGGGRIPPHEYLARQLARTRIASFSVHEGVGRTLKGRDLSRVRNAVWAKTGFED